MDAGQRGTDDATLEGLVHDAADWLRQRGHDGQADELLEALEVPRGNRRTDQDG